MRINYYTKLVLSLFLLFSSIPYASADELTCKNIKEASNEYWIYCRTDVAQAFYCQVDNAVWNDSITFYMMSDQTVHGMHNFSTEDNPSYNVGFINLVYFLPSPGKNMGFQLQVTSSSPNVTLSCSLNPPSSRQGF